MAPKLHSKWPDDDASITMSWPSAYLKKPIGLPNSKKIQGIGAGWSLGRRAERDGVLHVFNNEGPKVMEGCMCSVFRARKWWCCTFFNTWGPRLGNSLFNDLHIVIITTIAVIVINNARHTHRPSHTTQAHQWYLDDPKWIPGDPKVMLIWLWHDPPPTWKNRSDDRDVIQWWLENGTQLTQKQ